MNLLLHLVFIEAFATFTPVRHKVSRFVSGDSAKKIDKIALEFWK